MEFPGLAELTTHDIHKLFEESNLERISHLGGAEGIAKILGVDLHTGSKVTDLASLYGPNVIPEKPSPSFLQLLWAAYQDKTLLLLSAAALISLLIGVYEQVSTGEKGWIEGVAIIIAILIVVFVNALNDYQRERQFRMLSAKVKDRMVTVLRDSQQQRISIFDLSVGDVLIFEPGEVVPADGLLVDGHKVTIDESEMTGESDAVKKDTERNLFMLAGTRVIDGTGKMLVLATGVNSTQGKLMTALHTESTPTPLQQKLDKLADQIAKGGVVAALFMIVSLSLKFSIVHWIRNDWPKSQKIIQTLLHIVIQAVTVIVVAVPEGLPMAVTMALAFATTQMLKDNNLVRVMSSCETMGAATTICSDKTGTMTENKMTVVKFRICNIDGDRDFNTAKLDHDIVKVITDGIAINSTAFNTSNGWIGSKTEVALLNFAASVLHQPNCQALRDTARLIQRVPFSSERKFMTTAIEAFSTEGRPIGRIFLKGASEVVLGKCSKIIGKDWKIYNLSDEDQIDIKDCISSYASATLRTIGLAYKDIVDTTVFSKMIADPESLEIQAEFVWIGVVGIEDPLRDGVQDAVRKCQKAGIMVRMVTGDNLETAKAIAIKANILDSNGLAMEGSQFRQLYDDQYRKIIPRLQVLARSSPLDKQILVKKLKQYGEIVAVTGDGTNDGPALKAAHVGFSMGIAGTEVAKEASAIVLMDDNFTSIVRAVRWGRSVNESVRKFLQFQLSVNLTAVITAAVSALVDSSEESILTAVQLLWVNLIMDTYNMIL